MLSLPTIEAEDRVEEWPWRPEVLAGLAPGSSELLLRETGFYLEVSEVRQDVDSRYRPAEYQWVIARTPGE